MNFDKSQKVLELEEKLKTSWRKISIQMRIL